MADRNVWDPTTPLNHSDFTKRGFVVELCIYVFEHSTKDVKTVRADVEGASAIWCQSNINVQAEQFKKLSSPLPPSRPLDLNSTDLAGQTICNPMPDAVRDQFFDIAKQLCPDITKSIAVFYIPGARLNDGFATGCHQFRVSGNVDNKPEHFILLSDEADARTLAHELGHALFTREIATLTWINDDPDPKRDASKIHNQNPKNLMFPSVPANPEISPEQMFQAKQSALTKDQTLATGFKETKPFKLGVKFKKIKVDWSSDEYTSDDALESTWKFDVTVVKQIGAPVKNPTQTLTIDPLHWWDYDLNQFNLDFPIDVFDADIVEIHVTGEDWDFWSPNDVLPEIKKTHEKGGDNWGSGDHVETGESGDIKYSLAYNIRVDDQPRETVFRTICAL